MSYIPERKEKDCLNCGAIVQGRYCQNCGQENTEPKETLWHMFTHFFSDITHFDGKFFITVKDLLFKPGFLSKEYMRGRRLSYLHPIRMYLFTSAIFFLLFFTFFSAKETITSAANDPVTGKKKEDYTKTLQTKLKKDTANVFVKEKLLQAQDTGYTLRVKDLIVVDTGNGLHIGVFNNRYKTFEEYDSAEKTLPASRQDGWFGRRWTKIGIDIDRKFRENPEEAAQKFVESILHQLPFMLLISLPFFALILKLVYIRRKQFYYADHGVFTLHLYVFTFLLLLAIFLLSALKDVTHWGFIDYFVVLLVLTLFFYLYKAMRNFYGQRRGKTFLKFLLVAFWSFIMMLILFLLFMLFSAATL